MCFVRLVELSRNRGVCSMKLTIAGGGEVIPPLIDHARIDRHFAIDLFCEVAHGDISKQCKAHIETSNRSFGQFTRYTRERFDLAKMESENFGDDAVGCSGLRWGME